MNTPFVTVVCALVAMGLVLYRPHRVLMLVPLIVTCMSVVVLVGLAERLDGWTIGQLVVAAFVAPDIGYMLGTGLDCALGAATRRQIPR